MWGITCTVHVALSSGRLCLILEKWPGIWVTRMIMLLYHIWDTSYNANPSHRRQKCEVLNLELGKVVRSRKKSRDVPNFLVEGLPAGILGIKKSCIIQSWSSNHHNQSSLLLLTCTCLLMAIFEMKDLGLLLERVCICSIDKSW